MRTSLALLAALCAPSMALAAEVAPTGELHVFVFEVGTGAPLKGVKIYATEPPPPPPPPIEPTPEELAQRAADEAVRLKENAKRARKGLPPLPAPDYRPPPPPKPQPGPDDLLGRSDKIGQLVLGDMPVGEWVLHVEGEGGLREVGRVRIGPDFRSEALITWLPDGGASLVVEQPDADRGPVEQVEDGPTGVVRGRIVSDEDGQPIANARIFVRGSRTDATTGADGSFSLELPQGPRDLSIIHDKFATQAVNGVEVVAGDEVEVRVALVPAGLALADFTIRAPRIEGGTSALLDERRTSSAVGDVLGAEQMARSGDSSAAAALTRVTGLTLVGGRFVYVRGLGERYSSVLLNGATLPSPEPSRRVVPLDMFPAGVLESVVIQKSFSPDMPGEFGGGSIQLRTKNVPTEPIFSFSLSGGFNTQTSFRQGLDYKGGTWDFLGAGAGSRALPGEIEAASDVAQLQPSDVFCRENCYSAEDLERWGELYPVDFGLTQRQLPPDLGMTLTAGTGSDTALFGRPAGILVGASYANQWSHRRYFQRFFGGAGAGTDALATQADYDFVRTTNNVNVSTILALGASPAEGHELKSTTLVLRRTSDEARNFEGFNGELDTDINVDRQRYLERQLLVQQLFGEHRLSEGGTTLSWRYSFARATRLEPNRRGTQYNLSADETYFISLRSGGNQVFYSDLVDFNHDLGAELSVPFGPEVGEDGLRPTLFIGGMTADKRRASETRRFFFDAQGDRSRDPELQQKDANDIFTPDNIAPDAFQFEEQTLPTDNYSATQFMAAAYLKGEIPFTRWLRLMAGARLEHSNQFTTTFPLFAADGAATADAEIITTDLLPAATLTLSPSEKTNIRLGYGRTVSRPDFREMSPAPFIDVAGGGAVVGNTELRRATIDNYDLRVELYPSAGETLSLGLFYKGFNDPIESILEVSTERTTSWANTDGAWLYGMEFDVRKNLEFVLPELRDVYVAGNVALIQSRVTGITGIGTNTERPMQGQSPYVVNASLGYDNPESKLFATALYNVYGPRIVQAGARGLPDIYQQPIHAMDVVVGLQTASGWKLGLKGSNLLNAQAVFVQGPEETLRRVDGWNLGLKLGYSWKPKDG